MIYTIFSVLSNQRSRAYALYPSINPDQLWLYHIIVKSRSYLTIPMKKKKSEQNDAMQ